MKPPKTVRGGYRQPAARPGALALGGAFGLLDIAEDLAGALQVTGAGIRERQGSRGPLQQPGAETVLQRRDQPRHA